MEKLYQNDIISQAGDSITCKNAELCEVNRAPALCELLTQDTRESYIYAGNTPVLR